MYDKNDLKLRLHIFFAYSRRCRSHRYGMLSKQGIRRNRNTSTHGEQKMRMIKICSRLSRCDFYRYRCAEDLKQCETCENERKRQRSI